MILYNDLPFGFGVCCCVSVAGWRTEQTQSNSPSGTAMFVSRRHPPISRDSPGRALRSSTPEGSPLDSHSLALYIILLNGAPPADDTTLTCVAPSLLSTQEPLPFEGQSQYVSDYGPKKAEAPEFAAMPPALKPLPFEGQSTYRDEFVAKKGEWAEAAYVPVARAALPFEGSSRYQDDFGPKQAPMVRVSAYERTYSFGPSRCISAYERI